jgi:hypothetical protein
LARKKKDINLLDSLEVKKQRGLSPQVIAAMICIPVVALLAVSFVIGLSTVMAQLTDKHNSLSSYINNSQTKAAISEVDSLQSQSEQERNNANAVMNELRGIGSYPDFYVEQYDQILELAGYEIELRNLTFDKRSGTIRFNAVAAELSSLPRLIEQMRKSGMFSDIQYRGYVQTSSGAIFYGGSSSGTGEATSGGSAAQILINDAELYYYTIECLIVAPTPSLPELPSKEQGSAEAGQQQEGQAEQSTGTGAE